MNPAWLLSVNAVENVFSKIPRQRLKRGVFRSIADLQAAIYRYLAGHNDDPKLVRWTKSADAICAEFNIPASSV